MNARRLLVAGFFASMMIGCGSGGGDVVTDPNQLKPLSEAEKAEIKKQDAMIEEEEGASQKIIYSKEKAKN